MEMETEIKEEEPEDLMAEEPRSDSHVLVDKYDALAAVNIGGVSCHVPLFIVASSLLESTDRRCNPLVEQQSAVKVGSNTHPQSVNNVELEDPDYDTDDYDCATKCDDDQINVSGADVGFQPISGVPSYDEIITNQPVVQLSRISLNRMKSAYSGLYKVGLNTNTSVPEYSQGNTERCFKQSTNPEFHKNTKHHKMTEFTSKMSSEVKQLDACPVCSKSFRRVATLKRHIATVHNHQKSKIMLKHKCPNCPRTFALRNGLKRHIILHSESNPYVCEICGRPCISAAFLKQHRDLNHSQPQACLRCGKVCKNAATLIGHQNFGHCNPAKYLKVGRKNAGNKLKKAVLLNVTVMNKTNQLKRPFERSDLLFSQPVSSSVTLQKDRTVNKKVNELDSKSPKDSHQQHPDCSSFMPSNNSSISDNQNSKCETFDTKNVHTCNECGKCFNHRSTWCWHQKHCNHREHEHLWYVCPDCGRIVKKHLGFLIHLRMHRQPKQKLIHYKSKKATKRQHYRSFASELRMNSQQHALDSDCSQFVCHICSNCYTSEQGLQLHMRSHDAGCRKYPCNVCQKRFVTPFQVKNHLHTHRSEYPIWCSICEWRFKLSADLECHMKTEHHKMAESLPEMGKPRLHVCSQCHKSFPRSCTLKRHISTVHNHQRSRTVFQYKCPHCPRSFAQRNVLKRHAILHSDSNPYVCEICGKSCISAEFLKQHRDLNHSQPKACPECGKVCKNAATLIGHRNFGHCTLSAAGFSNNNVKTNCENISSQSLNNINQHKSPELVSERGEEVQRLLTCSECHKSFQRSGTLKRHIATVHKHQQSETILQYQCPDCPRSFARPKGLKRHSILHSAGNPYVCEICGKSCISAEFLKQHRDLNHSQPQTCPRCGKVCKNAATLIGHRNFGHCTVSAAGVSNNNVKTKCENISSQSLNNINQHKSPELVSERGEEVQRLLTCSECHKSFQRSGTLKRHIATVHKHQQSETILQYQCPDCPRSFARPKGLKRHSILHSAGNPYVCEICGKSCISAEFLKQHRDLNHSQPQTCPRCGKVCKNAATLIGHRNFGHCTVSAAGVSNNVKANCANISSQSVLCEDGLMVNSKQPEQGSGLSIVSDNSAELIQQFVCNEPLNNIKQHKSPELVSERGEEVKRLLPCSECHKSFQRSGTLKRHIATVHKHQQSETILQYQCPDCPRSFARPNGLKRHSILHSAGNPYVCEICGRPCVSAEFLKQHRDLNHSQPKACPECGKVCKNAATLIGHRNFGRCTKKSPADNGILKTQCENSQQSDRSVSRQHTVMKKSHRDSHYFTNYHRFKCVICAKQFLTRLYLKAHMAIHKSGASSTSCALENEVHSSVANENGSASDCKDVVSRTCIQQEQDNSVNSFDSKSTEDNLLIIDTTGDANQNSVPVLNVYQCRDCPKSFDSLTAFKCDNDLHLNDRFVMDKEADNTETIPTHSCSHCGQLFKTRASVVVHQNSCRCAGGSSGKGKKKTVGQTRYLCPECGQQFKLRYMFRTHLQQHAGEILYVCDLCGKSFTNDVALRSHHSYSHASKKKWSCTVCTKSFRTSGGLRMHRSVHTSERPFSCDSCKSSFKLSDALKVHVKHVHEKVPKNHCYQKRYACRFCLQRFVFPCEVRSHEERKHLPKPAVPKARRFKCSDCEKCFTYKHDLKEHIICVHGNIKAFSCPDCGRKFALLKGMKKHMKNTHKKAYSSEYQQQMETAA